MKAFFLEWLNKAFYHDTKNPHPVQIGTSEVLFKTLMSPVGWQRKMYLKYWNEPIYILQVYPLFFCCINSCAPVGSIEISFYCSWSNMLVTCFTRSCYWPNKAWCLHIILHFACIYFESCGHYLWVRLLCNRYGRQTQTLRMRHLDRAPHTYANTQREALLVIIRPLLWAVDYRKSLYLARPILIRDTHSFVSVRRFQVMTRPQRA